MRRFCDACLSRCMRRSWLYETPSRHSSSASSSCSCSSSIVGGNAVREQAVEPPSQPAAVAPLSTDEMEKIVRLIENDPRILMEVIAQLEPQNRRRLIVLGGAMEWFGKESAAQEVERADVDKDRMISPKDFDHWFESALKQRFEDQRRRREAADAVPLAHAEAATVTSTATSPAATTNAAAVAVAASAESVTMSTTTTIKAMTSEAQSATTTAGAMQNNVSNNSSDAAVPLSGLMIVAVEAALPFVGFGFLDNATMILAGDAIDGSLGFYLNCSVLASAAMGNICSGLVGMQVHGLIDRSVQKLFRNLPALTEAQMKNRRVFYAGHLGGTVGITIGLLLGMFPLLFLQDDRNEKSDYAMFKRWDAGHSGFIELAELESVLGELNVGATKETARRVMAKYGENNRLSYAHYIQLKDDLRHGKPVFD